MDEFSSSLVILFCFGFFICFHFFGKWSLSDRQGFCPLHYPLLQSTPQVSFVFLFSCQSDRLRFKPLCDKLFESTPLVLFVFGIVYLYRHFGSRSERWRFILLDRFLPFSISPIRFITLFHDSFFSSC